MKRDQDVQLTQFKELLSAVKKFEVFHWDEIKFETSEGLDIDLSDIFSTNEKEELFIILKNGSIRKAFIHIVDISRWPEKWKYPRFHIYKCKKIKEMLDERRGNRYRASTGKNNQFLLIKKDKEWHETLEICSFCLTQYNSHFNSNKTKQNFPLQRWITNPMSGAELPKVQLDICTVPNRYTESWSKISKKRREQEKYICEACSKDFSDKECRKFLHIHHIDADTRNNTRENLKVLCIECHSREYHHAHIKRSPMYKEWLKSKCCKMKNKTLSF